MDEPTVGSSSRGAEFIGLGLVVIYVLGIAQCKARDQVAIVVPPVHTRQSYLIESHLYSLKRVELPSRVSAPGLFRPGTGT